MKKVLCLLIMCLLIFLVGCKDDPCGDGVCDDVERANCPEDCADIEPGVLYLGFMLHLEGWDREPDDEAFFNDHAAAARGIADIFEERGGKITFEARPEFVEGCVNWNDNVLKELYERGHGIGVHADVGGMVEKEGLTQESFSIILTELKLDMEDLLGYDVRHVSGICSELDWVTAAIDAGYEFTTGNVGHCAMSLPIDKRPGEYKVCPDPSKCHGEIPVELKDRMYPWRMGSGDNWLVHDPNGELVLLASENILPSFSGGEIRKGVFSEEDVDEFIKRLDEALLYVDGSKVNTFYVSWSIGNLKLIDEEVFDYFFDSLQSYIDSGLVEWKTLPEVYDEYVNE